jgi:hypothetical protein
MSDNINSALMPIMDSHSHMFGRMRHKIKPWQRLRDRELGCERYLWRRDRFLAHLGYIFETIAQAALGDGLEVLIIREFRAANHRPQNHIHRWRLGIVKASISKGGYVNHQ